ALVRDVDLARRSVADLSQHLEVVGDVGERRGETPRRGALLAGPLDLDRRAGIAQLDDREAGREDPLLALEDPPVHARAVPAAELDDLDAAGRERDRAVPARDPFVLDADRHLAP